MKKRVFLIVLDSVGVGALPDAHNYGDQDANTLQHVAQAMNGIHLPTMASLGLGNILPLEGVSPSRTCCGAYGKMSEQSQGKDTITGHWEIAGITITKPFKTFPHGFPEPLMHSFEEKIGLPTLANRPASGTEIINELGDEHIKTGAPIVYTSADSVFQIAAHEEIISLEKLYEICSIARQLCYDDYLVARIIARPFRGTPGNFYRTDGRRDFAVKPISPTVLDKLSDHGYTVFGIGKIEDIFVKQGITDSIHSSNNEEGMSAMIKAEASVQEGLIFANLVDFDMKFGHRQDALGYGKALEQFDAWLPEFLKKLTAHDILIITADHGCDPTTPGTDHTREYVPLLVKGNAHGCIDLGIRKSFSDVAQTIADYFNLDCTFGKSFLREVV